MSGFAKIHLGLPFWGFEGWQGGLYTKDSRSSDYLRQYVRVFDAVEGNTTFYAEPPATTVEKWCRDTPEGFRFCFKLPRTITHDAMLHDVADDTARFLDRLAPIQASGGNIIEILVASALQSSGLQRQHRFPDVVLIPIHLHLVALQFEMISRSIAASR